MSLAVRTGSRATYGTAIDRAGQRFPGSTWASDFLTGAWDDGGRSGVSGVRMAFNGVAEKLLLRCCSSCDGMMRSFKNRQFLLGS